jgi:glycosyltransferase involved in cell wall biosynthesis
MSEKNIPNISIIMSVYNGEKTLEKAIDSILSQTYTDFEFIICDDASNDKTYELLNGYAEKDARIVLIKHTENAGLGSSLNDCLKIARGNYIARQDADDVSRPERIERTLDYLERTGAPYVGSGIYVFDDKGVFSKRLFEEKITKHVIAKKNPFFHPTMMFRKDVLEKVNGYRVAEETRRTEDYDLVMRLASVGIIGQNLQEYLYYVYEPMDAYLRHTRKTRKYEIRTRLYGLKLMNAPFYDYIYLIKPIIMSLIPHRLYKKLKQLQWGRSREENGNEKD